MKETKKINPDSLRVPTKAYSQGVLVPMGDRDMLFITGQLAQDFDGKVIAPGDIEKQTRVVFGRLGEILEEAGMSFGNLVKIQIFLKDIQDTKIVSSVRDEFLEDIRPASLMVAVSDFVKEGCMVEIEGIAVK